MDQEQITTVCRTQPLFFILV